MPSDAAMNRGSIQSVQQVRVGDRLDLNIGTAWFAGIVPKQDLAVGQTYFWLTAGNMNVKVSHDQLHRVRRSTEEKGT